MAMYRCYFLGADDRIRAAEDIEAGNRDEAVENARAMLRERTHHDAIELWEGEKKIYRSPPACQRS
jgi:hypothetical protein